MGSRGQYDATSRFSSYFEPQYHSVNVINGIKVLEFNGGANSKLPEYAKTSESYFSMSRDGEILHLRIYKDHFPVIDIDVGHSHHYGHGSGFVHVHDFGKDVSGHPLRGRGRDITAEEMVKYGHLISIMKGTVK